ncbi:hypothetical protein [Acetobacter senegalensis]|uniref:hypothetical protein n=1 Tax=Acetobacter senegalensis TaxID=446692 RepID=UPI001ED9DB17|nr:hypothetical protein [Acetobacter senegalensis]MCG4258220.1 hypothetical protein [Acetobacter senegalensis]MCG4268147.1 hypothetical protein [Acetobacter senegalensis]
MTDYIWGGLAVVTIAVLVWLVAYATRAGRNAQSVETSQTVATDAEIVAGVQANMAKAQAEGPQSKEQLLDRLDAGTG